MRATFSMRRITSWMMVAAIVCTLVVAISIPVDRCFADGWHNAALTTSSLDQWMADVKDVVPKLEQAREDSLKNRALRSGRDIEALKKLAANSAGSSEDEKPAAPSRAGGKLQSNLSAMERSLLERKAAASLEILAFMEPNNIYPREFPNFDLRQIPRYRAASKELLAKTGEIGASAVATQLRSALMGSLPGGGDVQLSDRYIVDLLELLDAAVKDDSLSAADVEGLLEAAEGRKPAPFDKLAAEIRKRLTDYIDIGKLIEMADAAEDRALRGKYTEMLRSRLGKASAADLLAAIKDPKLDDASRRIARARVIERLPMSSVLDLLVIVGEGDDSELRQIALNELQGRNPRYSDVKDDLAAIIIESKSENETVRRFAEWHVANAFQRAPISECFAWLASADDATDALIWKQIDGRIARADDDRRSEYAAAANCMLEAANADRAVKSEAIRLIGRLKYRPALAKLIESLPTMDRDLWPVAAESLRAATGQNFGPRAGDGVVESTVEIKKWQDWAAANGLR